MMNAAPFALYALAQIREQELERRARTAWQRRAPEEQHTGPVVRHAGIHLDAVAQGC